MLKQPEVWQRGPIPDITPLLQPVAHALLQAREELNELLFDFPAALLWHRPASVAAVGFHLQHLSGVLDRVFTYARGEALSDTQLNYLQHEGSDAATGYAVADLVTRFNHQVDIALQQLMVTDAATLTYYRGIGRAGLPSTVIGLFFHAAEHTMPHIGQLIVTVAVLKNDNLSQA